MFGRGLSLKEAFLGYAAEVGASAGQAVAMWDQLAQDYQAPPRAYHTLDHLDCMFSLAQDCRLENPRAFFWALVYHDRIYVPGRQDNEEQSARVAESELTELGESPSFIDLVVDLILLTKNHLNPTSSDAEYFLDCDLAILGSSPDEYLRYSQNVRQEFRAVPDEVFYPGRRKFLTDLLQRPRWYYTGEFYDRFEVRARENVAREVEGLAFANSTKE